MDLKDFKIPLLSQFSEVIDLTKKPTEDEKSITFDDAIKKVEDMISDKIAHTIRVFDEIVTIRMTKDAKLFVMATKLELVTVNVKTKEKHSVKPDERPRVLELIQNDTSVIVGQGRSSKLFIYDLATLDLKTIVEADGGIFVNISVSYDGTSMISIMKDNRILLWDLEKPQEFFEIATERYMRSAISHNKHYALFSAIHKLTLYSIGKKSLLMHQSDLGGTLGPFQFTPSDEFVVVGINLLIKIKNASTLADVGTFAFEEPILTMNVSSIDDIILLGLRDGNIIVYDHKNSLQPTHIKIHQSGIQTIMLDKDSSVIYSTELDQKKSIKSVQFPQQSTCKKLKCNQILGFSPHSKLFLKYKDSVNALNIQNFTEEQISKIEGINNVLFAGTQKVIVCHFANFLVINRSTGLNNNILDSDMEAPSSLVSDRNGDLLFAGYKNKIKVWDLQSCTQKSD